MAKAVKIKNRQVASPEYHICLRQEFNGFSDFSLFWILMIWIFSALRLLLFCFRTMRALDHERAHSRKFCLHFFSVKKARRFVSFLPQRNLSVVNPILTPISFEQRLQGYLNTVNGSFWMAFKKLLLLVWLFGHLWDDFLFPAYVRVKVRFLCVLTPGVPPFCPLWGKPNFKKSL